MSYLITFGNKVVIFLHILGKNGFTDTRDLYHIFINLIPGTEYCFEVVLIINFSSYCQKLFECQNLSFSHSAATIPSKESLILSCLFQSI